MLFKGYSDRAFVKLFICGIDEIIVINTVSDVEDIQ